MEHVAIVVKDLGKAVEFYGSMFGFVVRTRGTTATKVREVAFLTLPQHPGMELELIQDLVQRGDYSAKGIVNHLAFTVENIEAAMEYYAAKGVTFHTETPAVTMGGKAVFFNGPDGELLQLVERAQ